MMALGSKQALPRGSQVGTIRTKKVEIFCGGNLLRWVIQGHHGPLVKILYGKGENACKLHLLHFQHSFLSLEKISTFLICGLQKLSTGLKHCHLVEIIGWSIDWLIDWLMEYCFLHFHNHTTHKTDTETDQVVSMTVFTLYHTITTFNWPWKRNLLKTLWEKVKILLILSQTVPGIHGLTEEAFWKHCGKRRKCWFPAFSPFPTMFSFLSEREIIIKAKLNLSSANPFNLVNVINLSFGKGLTRIFFFSYNDLYPSQDKFLFLNNIYFFDCKPFQFGLV